MHVLILSLLLSKRVTGYFKSLLWLPCHGRQYSRTMLFICVRATHIKAIVKRGFTVNSDESKTQIRIFLQFSASVS